MHWTHSRLRMRFYWSRMFTHCAKCCRQCPGCVLANLTLRISELCYKFLVEAPFLVLHVDGYQVGGYKNFEGSDSYFIAVDGIETMNRTWVLGKKVTKKIKSPGEGAIKLIVSILLILLC